ncbi:hypothetical protein BH24BAC1_BH24BAC1_13030 [soil metagenome]
MGKETSAIDLLRENSRPDTQKRRQIAALAALGLVDFSIISLYQLGYIRHLPDPPGKLFDSDQVNASEEAVILGMPDGVISLGAYAAIMFLATAGSAQKTRSRWLDWLLGGIIAGQAIGAAQYLYKMVAVEKKVCLYCVTGAIINFVSVKPALELLTEGKQL